VINNTQKILIIDDQVANTELLENFLRINHFDNYRTINDSRKAIDEIQAYQPDLLLLDIMMPYVSGIDILNELRSAGILDSPMRVMVLTADATKETLKEVLKSGAHDMLRKPFDFVEFELRIRNLMHTNTLMKKLNDQALHLSELVDQRTEELLLKNEELEQFIYVASHDTQEPLRMITGFLQLLEKKYSTKLDEKGKQYIHLAVDGAARMKTLIKDMLAFSKAGKLNIEDLGLIDLNELIDDVLLGLKRLIDSSNALIKVDDLPKAIGMEAPMRQVIQNLLINAITYQPVGQQPIIKINSTIDESGSLNVLITDNGIGIAEEHQKKIFDIFTRLHTKETFPGSGVGLSISKKLMERMGGTITVKSALGEGAIFSLIFSSDVIKNSN
jgi:signal transduction histidine kinase